MRNNLEHYDEEHAKREALAAEEEKKKTAKKKPLPKRRPTKRKLLKRQLPRKRLKRGINTNAIASGSEPKFGLGFLTAHLLNSSRMMNVNVKIQRND